MPNSPDNSQSAQDDTIDFTHSPFSSPPDSPDASPLVSPAISPANERPQPHIPSFRSISDPASASIMSSTSSPIGLLQNARRPNGPVTANMRGAPQSSAAALPQSMEAKMRAFHLSRQGTPPRPQMGQSVSTGGAVGPPAVGGPTMAANLRLPPTLRPQPQNFVSAPVIPNAAGPKPKGLSARRGLKLPGGLPGAAPTPPGTSPALQNPNGASSNSDGQSGSMFNKFSEYVDTKTGTLKFQGKAEIHGHGIDFSSGSTFSISLDEVDTLEELGKGNYGTVYKVRHARPRIRRPGLGLAGNRAPSNLSNLDQSDDAPVPQKGTTGVIMAMKEIRLELDESKFAAIIMELDILHRCVSPYIIDFYGAFFQEGAVYICIEFMDGGSIDKIYGDGVPESVLRKITFATTQGLKSLKDDHNIIHRDVKPTNILANTRGQVKICDFGVSGNLVASIAKTNIGCQSYMAPERISGGGMAQAGATGGGTYSVQSDIWSLGLSVIECAMGRYPYPPETYNNIFSQLSAIVDGDPPDLPADGYSPLARDFVRGCLHKIPKLRPTYGMLLQHGWLAPLSKPAVISEDDEDEDGPRVDGTPKVVGRGGSTEDDEVAAWVKQALERKRLGLVGVKAKPALHAVSLDEVPAGGG